MFFCAKHFYIFYKKEMKKLLKWFTLVEILIVIVIIGILIWALVPRMQSAQWRARDVARKNDLSQLQSAILVSYQDKGRWPGLTSCTGWCDISTIKDQVLAAWMNSVPTDPLSSNAVKWLWGTWWDWQYRYMIVDSYGSKNWWFILMAKTEVEWGSNRVACDTAQWSVAWCETYDNTNACESVAGCQWDQNNTPDDTSDDSCKGEPVGSTAKNWQIAAWADIMNLKPCTTLEKDSSLQNDQCNNPMNGWDCTYQNESQLRYVLLN